MIVCTPPDYSIIQNYKNKKKIKKKNKIIKIKKIIKLCKNTKINLQVYKHIEIKY